MPYSDKSASSTALSTDQSAGPLQGFTASIREMANRGETGGCVEFAFLDAGFPVDNQMIMRVLFQPGRDPSAFAAHFGLEQINHSLSLHDIHEQRESLRGQGIFPFVLIGVPQGQFHLTQHLNFLDDATSSQEKPAFKLGGVPPFGNEGPDTLELTMLQKLVPEHGILLFKKSG